MIIQMLGPQQEMLSDQKRDRDAFASTRVIRKEMVLRCPWAVRAMNVLDLQRSVAQEM